MLLLKAAADYVLALVLPWYLLIRRGLTVDYLYHLYQLANMLPFYRERIRAQTSIEQFLAGFGMRISRSYTVLVFRSTHMGLSSFGSVWFRPESACRLCLGSLSVWSSSASSSV